MLTDLRVALAFLTTLPIPLPIFQVDSDPDRIGRAFRTYPIVGLLLGLILAALSWLLAQTTLSAPVHAGLLLGVWIALTGGLHLDGLMDTCDALFAPVDVERRLAILHDVHSGAFGVIGVLWLLGMKWVLLAQLLAQGSMAIAALILAPVWGRWMLVWAAERFHYARRESSLGKFMRQGLTLRQTVVASVFTVSISLGLALLSPMVLWVFVVPLFGIGLARAAASRLGGGLTGDLYGALCEVVEVIVLLLLSIV